MENMDKKFKEILDNTSSFYGEALSKLASGEEPNEEERKESASE